MNIWKMAERSISVSVDSYEDKNPVGRLRCNEQERELHFANLMQFLLDVEGMLRDEEGTEGAARYKRISPPDGGRRGGGAAKPCPGKLATVQLKILFRQHASWQGTVTWGENRQEHTFRSALELIMLLDSSLSQIEHLDYGHIV